MLFCDETCDQGNLQQVINVICSDIDNTRKLAPYKVAFLKCDQVITAINTASEWTTIKGTPENLITFPKLAKFKINKPEDTTQRLSLCDSTETVIKRVQKFDFSTNQLDNVTFTDSDMVCSFLDAVKGYTALVGDCKNKIIIYNKKWSTGKNPGLGNLTGNAWYEQEDDGLVMVNAEINFEIDKDMCIGFIQVSNETFNAIFN